MFTLPQRRMNMKLQVNSTNNVNQTHHVPTLNSMGYMTTILDPFCDEFIERAQTMTGSIADLGVAFGHTTKLLLENKNLKVYANDIAPQHLEYLLSELEESKRMRLKLFAGKLPEVYQFEDNSLEGVLAARCLHFLKGEEIENLASKVYKSLKPGGTFCVVAETPYMGHTQRFIPVFEERKAKGIQWPGYIENFQEFTDRKNTSKWINLLDPSILEQIFNKIGFKVAKCSFIPRTYFPAEVRLAGQESAGIIGIK